MTVGTGSGSNGSAAILREYDGSQFTTKILTLLTMKSTNQKAKGSPNAKKEKSPTKNRKQSTVNSRNGRGGPRCPSTRQANPLKRAQKGGKGNGGAATKNKNTAQRSQNERKSSSSIDVSSRQDEVKHTAESQELQQEKRYELGLSQQANELVVHCTSGSACVSADKHFHAVVLCGKARRKREESRKPTNLPHNPTTTKPPRYHTCAFKITECDRREDHGHMGRACVRASDLQMTNDLPASSKEYADSNNLYATLLQEEWDNKEDEEDVPLTHNQPVVLLNEERKMRAPIIPAHLQPATIVVDDAKGPEQEPLSERKEESKHVAIEEQQMSSVSNASSVPTIEVASEISLDMTILPRREPLHENEGKEEKVAEDALTPSLDQHPVFIFINPGAGVKQKYAWYTIAWRRNLRVRACKRLLSYTPLIDIKKPILANDDRGYTLKEVEMVHNQEIESFRWAWSKTRDVHVRKDVIKHFDKRFSHFKEVKVFSRCTKDLLSDPQFTRRGGAIVNDKGIMSKVNELLVLQIISKHQDHEVMSEQQDIYENTKTHILNQLLIRGLRMAMNQNDSASPSANHFREGDLLKTLSPRDPHFASETSQLPNSPYTVTTEGLRR